MAAGAIAASCFLACIVLAPVIALVTAVVAIVNRVRQKQPLLALAPLAIIACLFLVPIAMFVLRERPEFRSPQMKPSAVTAPAAPVTKSASDTAAE